MFAEQKKPNKYVNNNTILNKINPPPSQGGEGTLEKNTFFMPDEPDENKLPQLPLSMDGMELQLTYAQDQSDADDLHQQ